MKLIFTICIAALFLQSHGQSIDSTAKESNRHKSFSTQTYSSNAADGQKSMFSFKGEKQKKLVVKDNIVFTTYNVQMSPIENEILDLEVLERNALVKRDTSMLKTLWVRDFTLEEPSNKILVNGKNPLPYYTSLSRVVENFSVMDNVVFISGQESSQQLKANRSLADPVNVNFSHTWTRRNGAWKLTTKTHN